MIAFFVQQLLDRGVEVWVREGCPFPQHRITVDAYVAICEGRLLTWQTYNGSLSKAKGHRRGLDLDSFCLGSACRPDCRPWMTVAPDRMEQKRKQYAHRGYRRLLGPKIQ